MGLALGAIIGEVLTERPEVRRRMEFFVFLVAGLVLVAAEAYLRHKGG
jgi:prepilin signal peptidase PulO-like enzyme (type II secretory pathway)